MLLSGGDDLDKRPEDDKRWSGESGKASLFLYGLPRPVLERRLLETLARVRGVLGAELLGVSRHGRPEFVARIFLQPDARERVRAKLEHMFVGIEVLDRPPDDSDMRTLGPLSRRSRSA